MEEKLLIGFAEKSITPEDRPVSLAGQFHTRISEYVETPCMVNVIAVETAMDQTFLCSCDLGYISKYLVASVKEKVAAKHPEIKTGNIILAATHTHTSLSYDAPEDGTRPRAFDYTNANTVMPQGKKFVPNVILGDEVLVGRECTEFLAERISSAICQAWESRQHAFCSSGFGRASIGYCRRVVRSQGGVARLGYKIASENVFMEVECGNDTGIEMLFICDHTYKPVGVVASVACPSQIVEYKNHISSDYWGKARMFLKEHFGENFCTVGLCSAAGDQSPRDQLRWLRGVEPSMQDIEGTIFVGRRLANAIIEAFETAKHTLTDKIALNHKTEILNLPIKKVSDEEYASAKAHLDAYIKQADKDVFNFEDMIRIHPEVGTLFYYNWQQGIDSLPAEIHVVRFGDMAIASNPFELFLEFGNQIKVRSKAKQTMLIQLASDKMGYLPTAKAEEQGGYGTSIFSCLFDHTGGEVLVEKTLESINALFE